MEKKSNNLILVDRIEEKGDATRSNVYIEGKLSRYKALEDLVRSGPKVPGQTAIPTGRYPLSLRNSPKFSDSYYTKDNVHLIERKSWEKLSKFERGQYREHDLIWVMNVTHFEYILHHWGNTAVDSRGCLLIGSSFGMVGKNPAVLASRAAYVSYYAEVAPLVRRGGQFIEYQNSFKPGQ